MDLVEEEDFEEMAAILGAREDVGRVGAKVVEGNERVENPEVLGGETAVSENGVKADGGKSAKVGRTTQPKLDRAIKETESLKVTECNVDADKVKKVEALEGAGGKINLEGEKVKKEEGERKISLRGKRMPPAWVRRESIQWESSQRSIGGVQENLQMENLPKKDDGECDAKSQNTSFQEGEEVRGSKEFLEEKPQSVKTKENIECNGGIRKVHRVTVAKDSAWKEEEIEELDFCKVEEKLSEWRRRRKSGRDAEEDRDPHRVR